MGDTACRGLSGQPYFVLGLLYPLRGGVKARALCGTAAQCQVAGRNALGAERRDVGRLVLNRGTAIVLLAMAVGLGAAFIAGPLLANLLYGVNPRDPIAMAAGPLVLGLVAGWRSGCRRIAR